MDTETKSSLNSKYCPYMTITTHLPDEPNKFGFLLAYSYL